MLWPSTLAQILGSYSSLQVKKPQEVYFKVIEDWALAQN